MRRKFIFHENFHAQNARLPVFENLAELISGAFHFSLTLAQRLKQKLNAFMMEFFGHLLGVGENVGAYQVRAVGSRFSSIRRYML